MSYAARAHMRHLHIVLSAETQFIAPCWMQSGLFQSGFRKTWLVLTSLSDQSALSRFVAGL
jgi:hypothetical protein